MTKLLFGNFFNTGPGDGRKAIQAIRMFLNLLYRVCAIARAVLPRFFDLFYMYGPLNSCSTVSLQSRLSRESYDAKFGMDECARDNYGVTLN